MRMRNMGASLSKALFKNGALYMGFRVTSNVQKGQNEQIS